MSLADYFPYTDYDVREQVNNLFSRKILGAVLVGKFIGDYAALWATRAFGVDLGYAVGIFLTISVFIYWERIERKIEKSRNEISDRQRTWGDYE